MKNIAIRPSIISQMPALTGPRILLIWNSAEKCANAGGALAKSLYKCETSKMCQRRRMPSLKAYNNYIIYTVFPMSKHKNFNDIIYLQRYLI